MLERYEQPAAHLPEDNHRAALAAGEATTTADPHRLQETATTRPRFRRAWAAALALAACIAVLALVYVRFRPVARDSADTPLAALPSPALTTYVQDSHHCTVIPRIGPAVALNQRYQLKPGDIIATAPDGNGVLRFAEETTMFILAPDTRAWITQEGRTKFVHLTSGQIYGDVATQKNGAQWRILTTDGEARVLGTQLAVSALAGGTRVAVTSGLVRVTARDSRESIETPAGFAAELTPTTARLVKLAPTEPTRVVSFTVINADTNQPLQTLVDGALLDLATLPTRRINIQANCEPRLVGVVRFTLAGTDATGAPVKLEAPPPEAGWHLGGFPEQIENFFPYMLAGDPAADGQPLPGHSYAWTPATGRYTLRAVPYAVIKNAGARGEPLSVKFEIIDSAAR